MKPLEQITAAQWAEFAHKLDPEHIPELVTVDVHHLVADTHRLIVDTGKDRYALTIWISDFTRQITVRMTGGSITPAGYNAAVKYLRHL